MKYYRVTGTAWYTLTTKEYRTVSSMLLMFRWRTSKESFSSTVIILTIWPGILRDIVFKITFDPDIFASTSATAELQHAASPLTFSSPKRLGHSGWKVTGCSGLGLGLGPGLGLKLFLCFLDSKACRTWCNSFINSITPPIMDAWSPLS